MEINQLKEYVIIPVLKKLNLYSEEAVSLLAGTAMVESLGGKYLHQIKGPACGIYQMEPATAQDIYENYLAYKDELFMNVRNLYVPRLSFEENLTMNLAWATAMCRIHYLRISKPIPKDFEGRANYWKRYYNTNAGKGFVQDYLTKAKGIG